MAHSFAGWAMFISHGAHMMSFRRTIPILPLLILALTTSPAPAADPPREVRDATIDQLVQNAMKRWQVPGAAVVVVHKGSVKVLAGYGVKCLDDQKPVTTETVFPLASCSKAFTSTLMAMLVDAGAMQWEDPVKKHLPGFRISDPHADALLTMRDALSHRTGLSGHDLLWYRAPWNLNEVLRRTAYLPVEKPFRTTFQYSSIMVAAAGRAMANRADRPWEELVAERITTPLGMTGVTFTTQDPAFLSADLPCGYELKPGQPITRMPRYESPEANPAGSINVTARDMVPWLEFHASGGLYQGKRLVSEANLRETHTPHVPLRMEGSLKAMNPDTVQMSYGMGWLVYDYRGKRILAHGGKIDGYRIHIAVLPEEQLSMALFHNVHDINMNQALGNMIVDHLLGLPKKDWHALFLQVAQQEQAERMKQRAEMNRLRNAEIRPILPLKLYAGNYTDDAYGQGQVTWKDGQLTWEWSSFTCPLEPWQGEVFRIRDGFFADQFLEFRVRQGQADALRFAQRIFTRE